MAAQREADETRAVAATAQWTLTMLSLVERGHVPLRRLQRVADHAVVVSLGPFPARKQSPVAPVRVGTVHARVTEGRLGGHAVAAARRPDGTFSGYVLEVARASTLRDWRVSELTSVEEGRILGPRRRAYDQDLPADLSGLIAAATYARDIAVMRLRQLNEARQHAGAGARRRSRAEIQRLRDALDKAEQELAAYQETQAARAARRQIIDAHRRPEPTFDWSLE